LISDTKRLTAIAAEIKKNRHTAVFF